MQNITDTLAKIVEFIHLDADYELSQFTSRYTYEVEALDNGDVKFTATHGQVYTYGAVLHETDDGQVTMVITRGLNADVAGSPVVLHDRPDLAAHEVLVTVGVNLPHRWALSA